MKRSLFFLFTASVLFSKAQTRQEIAGWQAQAARITVAEDKWGVPHIYGKTDADAVFGLLYVQCSQNFARVERNYLEIMGRLSEIEGEKRLYDDLQMRLIYDSAAAKKDYDTCAPWFKKLLNAFADGVNYYLYKHPETKPLVLKKFQPWFPLMYTDGSIAPTQTGGLTVQDLKNFYEGKDDATSYARPDLSINDFNPSGSNGFAVGPSKTASGKAILYINPHVTFYFRTEAHLVSEEGLNAYGAATWGQFFIYQGFNEHCGWMHTSSYADVADVYEETIEQKNNALFYYQRYGHKLILERFRQKEIGINYKSGDQFLHRVFPAYFTVHGPVMGKRNKQWLSLKEHNRSLSALMQSWLRTKAKGFDDFKKVMNMRSNNSNNTVFADDKGNIAYWHGNFMPKRDTSIDWSMPVNSNWEGAEWQGLHTMEEMIHIYNPKSGFLQNCNSTPFTSSGESSPLKKNYPAYMAPDGQNGRAINAARLLSKAKNITLDSIIKIGYDRYMTAFDILLPALFHAYDELGGNDAVKKELDEPITLLKSWDRNASASSVATTLAMEWATKLATKIPPAKTTEAATNAIGNYERMAKDVPAEVKLRLLSETISDLQKLYGKWNIAWGDVNRYQRAAGNVFNDEALSLPVGLGSSAWGSLPSFVSRRFDTKKRYGYSGNSFIAAVEFGKPLKAKTIVTGGESFDPASTHYTDQAEGYLNGQFKDIFFYKADVLKNAERVYHPGE